MISTSWKGLPMTCNPIGRFLLENPQGIEMAGIPARLAETV
jgi:hypothetical protein